MKKSSQNSSDPEDNTEFDVEDIEDSLHLGIDTVDSVFEPVSQLQDAHDTEDDTIPDLVYVDEDDSRTPFSFDSSLD